MTCSILTRVTQTALVFAGSFVVAGCGLHGMLRRRGTVRRRSLWSSRKKPAAWRESTIRNSFRSWPPNSVSRGPH